MSNVRLTERIRFHRVTHHDSTCYRQTLDIGHWTAFEDIGLVFPGTQRNLSFILGVLFGRGRFGPVFTNED